MYRLCELESVVKNLRRQINWIERSCQLGELQLHNYPKVWYLMFKTDLLIEKLELQMKWISKQRQKNSKVSRVMKTALSHTATVDAFIRKETKACEHKKK